MTDQNTKRYVDVLGEIVSSLNGRYRKKIAMRPIDINYANAGLVMKRHYPHIYYGKRQFPLRFQFALSDKVRVALHKKILRHGYLPNYSDEIYTIIELIPSDPPRYKLATLQVTGSGNEEQEEEVDGLFYAEELKRVEEAELEHIS